MASRSSLDESTKMALRSSIAEGIKRTLPHLEEDIVGSLLDYVILQGVKKLMDLRRIQVEMLKTILDHVDATDLFDEWQAAYGSHNKNTATCSNSNQEASTSRTPLATIQSNAQAVISSLPVFDVDSPYTPSGVKHAMRTKTRPTSSDREDFVVRIVDRCREVVPNFQKAKTLEAVAKEIVAMYPASFQDTILISEHGSDSLASQLKNRYDNHYNRAPVAVLTEKQKAAPAAKEAAGCSNWNPPIPEDETEENITKLMNEMKKMHKISEKNWEWNLIKRKLTSSYYLQRKDINGKLAEKVTRKRKRGKKANAESDDEADQSPDLTILEIQGKWPFLFTAKGINIHFKLLTGKDFCTTLHEYISKSGEGLIDFLAAANSDLLNMKRTKTLAETQGFGATTISTLMLMLIKYLDEDRGHFITFLERTTELAEVADLAQFPDSKTPVMICAGPNIFDFDKIFFAIDNKVLCTADTILEGVTLLFTSYFVFNYVYSPRLSCFLTFIQKAILGINPINSSKCVDPRTSKIVNQKVVKFNNRFILFQQEAAARVNLNTM